MPKYSLYQVDAFSDQAFGGNPAAVCLLNEWLEDDLMQKIAEEINLSETAFLLEGKDKYELRWFTPRKEVTLCGHATLATAHVIFEELKSTQKILEFETKSGVLTVEKDTDIYKMDLPADEVEVVFYEDGFESVEVPYNSVFQGKDDYLFVLDNEEQVLKAKPDMKAIKRLDKRGLIITAKGNEVDFVSRCFYPSYGIEEDPVTGSAHTLLAPYWANRLGKIDLTAEQLSKRRGKLRCRLNGDKITLFGKAKTVIHGHLYL